MTSNHTQNWDNYWEGRSAQNSGNALLGVGIENNQVLTNFWEKIFKEVPKSTKLADFACGAGSVLSHANRLGLTDLTGLDVSTSAIDVLKTKIPNVVGVVGPVDKTPFELDSFDMIVSQFGFEYAGGAKKIILATNEMGRILKPEGKIALVTHIKDGAIAKECFGALDKISLIQQSGFFEVGADTFKSVYKAQKTSLPEDRQIAIQSMSNLNVNAAPIMAWLRTAGARQKEFGRFAYHLLESTHKLLLTYQKYTLGDCLSWLEAMHSEVQAYEGRMLSMTQAAIPESLIFEIRNNFINQGLRLSLPEKLFFKEGDLPAAWVLRSV